MAKKKKKKNNNYKKQPPINDIYFSNDTSCNGIINYIIRQWAKKVSISEISRKLFISTDTVHKIVKPYYYDHNKFNSEKQKITIDSIVDYNLMYNGVMDYIKKKYEPKPKKIVNNPIMDYLYNHIDEIKHDYLEKGLTRIDMCVKYDVSEYFMSKFIKQNSIYKYKTHVKTE